ncbi:MAG: outer membrane lipoprotein-sorting protein [Cyclobacteriaceae bacterium]|nr:outer membrane lipoprotein-sorting protein [Cyclobacteriaceae bacterium]
MKTRLLVFALALVAGVAQAQTADEILAKYFENTGGIDKWKALQGIKVAAKANQGGMEFPVEMVFMKDGRQFTKYTIQGKEIKQGVYDGSTLWSLNFMTQKAEKSDAESTENFKANIGSEYPFVFLNLKEKGHKVELLGKEQVEGTDCFKLKLTKNPIKVDGKPEESVEFYFFDTENFVPLMMETEIKSGQGKGMVVQVKFSDFQEVKGLMMPFSWAQGVKGQPSSPLIISAIEPDPKVDAAAFKFPEGQ